MMERPRKIVIKGTSGAGKTTLGGELGRRLGLPFVELDALAQGPNWQVASPHELRASVDAALAGRDRWIVDGNYDSRLGDFVNAQADLVVWLDLPLGVKLRRLLRRTHRRVSRREALWNGNRETWLGAFWGRESLFVWMLRAHFRHRREFPARFAGKNVVRLRSPAEVERWLATLAAPCEAREAEGRGS
jgi:hypothetical protein